MSAHVFGFMCLEPETHNHYNSQWNSSWERESIAPSRGFENEAAREVHLPAALS